MEIATPLSHWIGFHVYIVGLLGMELLYARRGGSPTDAAAAHSKMHRTAIVATVLWIVAALAFGLFVFQTLGSQSSVE